MCILIWRFFVYRKYNYAGVQNCRFGIRRCRQIRADCPIRSRNFCGKIRSNHWGFLSQTGRSRWTAMHVGNLRYGGNGKHSKYLLYTGWHKKFWAKIVRETLFLFIYLFPIFPFFFFFFSKMVLKGSKTYWNTLYLGEFSRLCRCHTFKFSSTLKI